MASSDSDTEIAAAGLMLVYYKRIHQRKKKRKRWCKEWLMKRNACSHVNLLNELHISNQADWQNCLRMSQETYSELLSLVTPLIEKKNTVMRLAITPHERLSATLGFLTTGKTYEDLKFSTIISPQALGYIIPETCEAVFEVLHKEYLKFPKSMEEWKNVATIFEERWHFPHCLGAMDGKHIDIVPPAGCGSEFYNYKGRHSMVLMAIVDGNYKFIMSDIGTNGRISDGGMLQHTTFFQKLQDNSLQLPPEDFVKGTNTSLPYVFVADDAFPLRPYLMTPFRQAHLTTNDRKIFNYRISRARRIVENAFGILASRFRIFHTKINLKPPTIETVVMACCVLHNFLMEKSPRMYASPDCFDRENTEEGTIEPGCWTEQSTMQNLARRNIRSVTNSAKITRDLYMQYFVNEGQVPWQLKFIK